MAIMGSSRLDSLRMKRVEMVKLIEVEINNQKKMVDNNLDRVKSALDIYEENLDKRTDKITKLNNQLYDALRAGSIKEGERPKEQSISYDFDNNINTNSPTGRNYIGELPHPSGGYGSHGKYNNKPSCSYNYAQAIGCAHCAVGANSFAIGSEVRAIGVNANICQTCAAKLSKEERYNNFFDAARKHNSKSQPVKNAVKREIDETFERQQQMRVKLDNMYNPKLTVQAKPIPQPPNYIIGLDLSIDKDKKLCDKLIKFRTGNFISCEVLPKPTKGKIKGRTIIFNMYENTYLDDPVINAFSAGKIHKEHEIPEWEFMQKHFETYIQYFKEYIDAPLGFFNKLIWDNIPKITVIEQISMNENKLKVND